MTEYAPYFYLDTSRFERVIALSDVHGDLDGFLGALSKAGFSERDALIIVGDILEKGERALPLLRKVMEMSAKGNVFMLMGNNDAIFSSWREGAVSDADMLGYLQNVPHSTIFETARELGLGWDTLEEVTALKNAIFENYKGEIAFLDSLPYIIETEFAVFVHAGLGDGPLCKQEPSVCLSAPEYGIDKRRHKKPVIVGHWPASNYCTDIIRVDPYFNSETGVISIDGGNSLKSWGQINYLVFKDGRLETSGSYDELPKITVLEDQEETKWPTLLIHPKTVLEILEAGEKESLCYLPFLGEKKLIPNRKIYEYRGKHYCYDYTDYKPGLSAGDTASLCQTDEYGALIKKNGVVGYYTGKWKCTH